MKFPALLAAGALLCPSTSFACRNLIPEAAFEHADVVLVGWIYEVTSPALEALPLNSTELDVVVAGMREDIRVLSIRVTKARKGAPVTRQVISVSRCRGALNAIGSRVIAYQFRDGTWQVDSLKNEGAEVEP